MKKERFVIIDGSGLMWRAYHRRNPPRRSPLGDKTDAVHAYCMILADLLRMLRPDYLLVALDVPRSTTFRRKLDPSYKADRESSMSDAVSSAHKQLDLMDELTGAFGIATLRVRGFEADDVIASVVDVCASDAVECVVVTTDHDLQQLVGCNCCIYDPFKDLYRTETTVQTQWGVPASKIVEVMTLAGDPGDNVPGVPGIGMKTATKAIQDHGSVEEALQHAPLWANAKMQMALVTTNIDLCRQLVALRTDVPLAMDSEALAFDGISFKNAATTLLRLGLRAAY